MNKEVKEQIQILLNYRQKLLRHMDEIRPASPYEITPEAELFEVLNDDVIETEQEIYVIVRTCIEVWAAENFTLEEAQVIIQNF